MSALAQFDAQFPGPLAGVDEVGYGPWAGPVVTAAAILPTSLPAGILDHINDSKKLSAKKRLEISQALRDPQHGVIFYVAEASVQEIDTLNVRAATLLAMKRAVEGVSLRPACVLVDGNARPSLSMPTHLIVKGDQTSAAIAAASILAKVHRDQLMMELAQQFPGYGWETNVGYGTQTHQEGLALYGVTPHHRRSYAPIKALIMNQAIFEGA